MSELFEETSIAGMTLHNRFVRSATWEGLANRDGSVTHKLKEKQKNLTNSLREQEHIGSNQPNDLDECLIGAGEAFRSPYQNIPAWRSAPDGFQIAI